MTPLEEAASELIDENIEDARASINVLIEQGLRPKQILKGIPQGDYDVLATREAMAYAFDERFGKLEFLDDFILPTYREHIQHYAGKAKKVLGILRSNEEGILIRPNAFSMIQLADAGILPKGKRLAEGSDIIKKLEEDSDFFEGVWTGFGLGLRTNGDSYARNDLIAKNLWSQFEHRGIDIGKGIAIPYKALRNRENTNSDYGLVLDLKDEIPTQELGIEPLDKYDWKWEKNDGLSGLYLYNASLLVSYLRFLDYSNDSGRVVVLSGEATRALEEAKSERRAA